MVHREDASIRAVQGIRAAHANTILLSLTIWVVSPQTRGVCAYTHVYVCVYMHICVFYRPLKKICCKSTISQ